MTCPPAQTRADMVATIAAMVAAMNELADVDDRLEWLDEQGWMMPRDSYAFAEMLDAKEQLIEDLMTANNRVAA